MGVSRTPEQFARKIAQLPTTIERARSEVARKNVKIATANALNQMHRDVNSAGRVTNAGKNVKSPTGFVVGKAGAKLTVNSRPAGKTRYEDKFLVRAVGPWQLVNNKAVPHVISPAGQGKLQLLGPVVPKGKRLPKGVYGPRNPGIGINKPAAGRTARGRRNRATVLKLPWGYRQYALHRGHKGKKTWQKAFNKTRVEVAELSADLMKAEVARIF